VNRAAPVPDDGRRFNSCRAGGVRHLKEKRIGMFHVSQRVICDRMGINHQWTDHSGRVEIETYYDVEHGLAGVYGFPQRGGIYTIAGIYTGKDCAQGNPVPLR
jgi:hypothetical protein